MGIFEYQCCFGNRENWIEKYFDVIFDGLERHFGHNCTIPEDMHVVKCSAARGDTHKDLLVGILKH